MSYALSCSLVENCLRALRAGGEGAATCTTVAAACFSTATNFLRPCVQEEKARRREAKRRQAIARLYFCRWRDEVRRIVGERARQRRLAAALKACRVGFSAARVSWRWQLLQGSRGFPAFPTITGWLAISGTHVFSALHHPPVGRHAVLTQW